VSVFSDLLIAGPSLALIAGGVALVAVAGRDRDRTADQHTVDDYRPAPEAGVETARRRLRRVALDVLPPAPPGTQVPLTLYAEQVVVELMRARYGTTNPAVIAGRVLREIAAEQQTKTPGRGLCGPCDAGLPMACTCVVSTTDRDMTGAFPVVAVA